MKRVTYYFEALLSKTSYTKQNLLWIGLVVILLALPIISIMATREANFFSHASTTNVVEPETESLSGTAAVVNDATASGGQAIDFGTGCTGVELAPGQDVQAALDANPVGTTFCFAAGTYRLDSPLEPKNDQQLIGAYGAVLNGSKVVTGFVQSGSNWVATGFLPATPETHGQCTTTGCTYTQDVFLDGQPLTRVTQLADLATGKFYEDFAANQIYLRDDPTGKEVEQAYASEIISSSTTGITVKGFIIEKAAGAAQEAAVWSQSNPANWTIEYNEIRYNHSGGVYANDGSIVRNNYIHHQGQTGIYGDYGDILVEDNEVAYNNTAGYDFLWEAGGSKWARTDGTIIRGNYFHDNNGPGIWTDILNENVLIEDNVVVRNKQNGIFHEISYSAIIRNNISMDNTEICAFSYYCGAQINISASPDVEVYGNTVRGWGGIGMLQQDRSADYPSSQGAHLLQNVYIHDNVSHMASSAAIAGGVTDTGDTSIFTSNNNRYENNTYHILDMAGQYFYWADGYHQIAAWQGLGMDTTGTFDTNIDNSEAPVPDLTVGPQSSPSGSVTTTISIPADGTYRVWTRIMAPDTTNDSYALQIDNGSEITVGDSSLSPNTWTWIDYQDGDTDNKVDLTLIAGTHTLSLIGYEPDVKIDRLIITDDLSCTPTGTGDNCSTSPTDTPTPTATPTITPTPTSTPTVTSVPTVTPTTPRILDIVPPVVAVTSPSNGAVYKRNDTILMSANASDNVQVTKVHFVVNGTLICMDTTAPYTCSWRVPNKKDVTYTIVTQAYDAMGNASSASVQIKVKD